MQNSAELLFARAAELHVTHFSSNNVRGFVALVRREERTHLAFVPLSVLHDEEAQYLRVESNQDGKTAHTRPLTEDEAVHIRTPISQGHAFSVPVSTIYSLIVHPPSLTRWQGSITVNASETTLPTLFLLDHVPQIQNSSEDVDSDGSAGPSRWTGAALLAEIGRSADLVQSQVEPSVYLVNPSRADVEAHALPTFAEAEVLPPSLREQARKSTTRSVLHQSLSSEVRRQETSTASMSSARFELLSGFSKITRGARTAAQAVARPILSHRLARPLLPHLPSPLLNLQQAQPEWVNFEDDASVEGFSPARVYLARWSRIVSEQGERARRQEIGAANDGEEASALGAFELLSSTYSITRPRTTRAAGQAIMESEWTAWFDDSGKLLLSESEARGRIFQRGLAPAARKSAWPFLHDVFAWDSTALQRKEKLRSLTAHYESLKASWRDDLASHATDSWKEESHRIEIDCKRTDRNHPMFTAEVAESNGNEDTPQIPTNPHIQQMQEILLTYNALEGADSYVQGMSDLASPIYISLEGDEVLVFWIFVNFMRQMGRNFLRDQSGMKDQLSSLQKLIQIMDPAMYRHLTVTDSLNLFFAFRWILVAFKREFPIDQTCLIWETLWTKSLGRNFHLFFALAILSQHRAVIMRYCLTFDEVLKYVNDLSGSLDADPLLSLAEVLARSLEAIVELSDRNRSVDAISTGTQSTIALRQAMQTASIDDDTRKLLPSAGG